MNIKSAKWAIKELEKTELRRVAWEMKRNINLVRRDMALCTLFYIFGLAPLIISPSLDRFIFAVIMCVIPVPTILSTRKRYELTALGIYNEWFRQASEIERQDIRKFMDYYTEKTGMIK